VEVMTEYNRIQVPSYENYTLHANIVHCGGWEGGSILLPSVENDCVALLKCVK
jgi:hypothetical protein